MKFVNSGRGFRAAALMCAVFASHVAFGQASASATVDGTSAPATTTTGTNPNGTSGMKSGKNVDNSGVNKRDRQAGAVTADQQSSGTTDTEITRQIRKALIADKDLSIYAHNIKIITIGGVVTLKGPVKSVDEKNKAVSFAKSVAGVSKVDNQISIKR